MAALDWASRVTTLQLLSAVYIEEDVVDELIASLEAIGVPYDAVYTAAVDAQKAADEAANVAASDAWAVSAEASHDQAYKAINWAEDELSITRTTPVAFDPSVEASNYAVATLTSRFGVLANRAATAATQGSLTNDLGLRDTMKEYQIRIKAAYDARPAESYSGSYGSDRTVSVPTLGQVTVRKAEELLQPLMDQADEQIALVNFIWP